MAWEANLHEEEVASETMKHACHDEFVDAGGEEEGDEGGVCF
jgi:hypothetical protein